MKLKITITAIVLVIVCFGMMHSLHGIYEIINLTVMGLSLLYLMVLALMSLKKKEDS